MHVSMTEWMKESTAVWDESDLRMSPDTAGTQGLAPGSLSSQPMDLRTHPLVTWAQVKWGQLYDTVVFIDTSHIQAQR